MMDRQELQKLRDLPIEGVAERLGLRVSRHKCLCPFHDDHHASLSFKVSKNTFRCFVCGASGGPIDLVMRHLHVDFMEACKWLADEHNIILDEWKPAPTDEVQKPFDATRFERYFEHPWVNEEARRFLFEERKLDPRVVRWCRLSSWKDRSGTPWLEIPYFDRQGKLIGIQNRNLIKGGLPRFRFPQGGGSISFYNQPVLNMLCPGDKLFIAEGCSDCWSLLSAGHKAIAIPSATLLTKKDVEQLQTLSSELSVRYEMWPDNDTPGERLFLQLKEVLPSLVHHQLPPSCKDFSDLYTLNIKD
jgi:DNA primase